jgi:hypothetical protein
MKKLSDIKAYDFQIMFDDYCDGIDMKIDMECNSLVNHGVYNDLWYLIRRPVRFIVKNQNRNLILSELSRIFHEIKQYKK